MITLGVFLVTLGAVSRITRFVTDDHLAAPVRTAAIWLRGPDSQLAGLIECPWCLSIWVAAALVPVAYLYGTTPWFTAPAIVLTVSQLHGLVSQHLDD